MAFSLENTNMYPNTTAMYLKSSVLDWISKVFLAWHIAIFALSSIGSSLARSRLARLQLLFLHLIDELCKHWCKALNDIIHPYEMNSSFISHLYTMLASSYLFSLYIMIATWWRSCIAEPARITQFSSSS